MSPLEIPVCATERESRGPAGQLGALKVGSSVRRPRVLVTGSSGVLGTALARDLGADHDLIGLDPLPVSEPQYWAETMTGSVGERDRVLALVAAADYALHLAHGANQGWEGLRLVDIDGTRNVLDGALRGVCRRVVICSSNHVVGWSELDYLARVDVPLPVGPKSPPRPDGLYGVAKAAGEALARAAAELAGLPVSVLRIGTVRADDDLDRAVTEPGFAYIGDLAAVRRRLQRTWLFHVDLVRIVREEFAAAETFRLRYATSSPDNEVWSNQPLLWNAPEPVGARRRPPKLTSND